jgi:hypothetical protein
MKMKKLSSLAIVAIAALGLAGCAATKLSPAAQRVMVTSQKAPKSCKYLGMATANQGNFFTGAYTSNQNLQSGAFNDLRNQAAKMHGNRVVLLMSHAADTTSGGGVGIGGIGGGALSGQETNVAITGNIYRCPNQ